MEDAGQEEVDGEGAAQPVAAGDEAKAEAEETGPADGEARAEGEETGAAEETAAEAAPAEESAPAEAAASVPAEESAAPAAEEPPAPVAEPPPPPPPPPPAADIQREAAQEAKIPKGKGLHIHLRDDKLLTSYKLRCQEVSRKPNLLVNRSIIECAAADDGALVIDAPGNLPHTFCSRLDDVDMTLLNRTMANVAVFLTRVDLSYNSITSQGVPALVELLKAATDLSILNVKGNEIDGAGMKLLLEGNLKKLKRLDVSGNPLDKDGGLAVAEYLQNNKVLQEVWINDCGIDCDVLIAISAVLHVNNQSLRVCSVENPRLVNLQGEHCYHFSRMLRVNAGLQEIYLGKHRFRDRDVEIMVSYLMENMALKVLDLRCNEIGTDGAIALSKWLATSGCQLQKLNLAANRIGHNEVTVGIEALADSLLANKFLSHLNLNNNRLCPDALRILGQAIDQRETKQMRLELFHNDWNDEAACVFQAIFKDTSRVFPVEADFCLTEVDDRISVAQIN